MIERINTKKIANYLLEFPSVAILGPRQIGKTTLSKNIIPTLHKPALYIDLERPSDMTLIKANPEIFLEKHKDQCIIIDEVQRMPSLFPLLRPIIDDHRVAGRFLLLGSASPKLLKESSESLAGRIIYTELHAFNLLEIDHQTSFYHLWLYGGFPQAFLKKEVKKIVRWHESFLSTYFERDLPLLNLNLDPDLLRRTFAMLCHIQGSPCNLSLLSKSLHTGRRTFERILQFFVNSYMVRKLLPFFPNIKKRLVKSPKYYVRDSGIFHHMLNISTLKTLFENPALGFSWEGFVIEQIAQLDLELIPYFYRTQAGAECDLVLVRGTEPIVAIEAKTTNTPSMTKSFFASIQTLQTKENYIVVPSCKIPYSLKENTTVCSLTWLLSQLLDKYA